MNSSSVGATTFVFGVALLARVLLLWWDSQEWLGRRIEISTPVNQWMRVREGIVLFDSGLSPYSGDVYHETPLVLWLFKILFSLGEWAVQVFFIATDFLVALCLTKVSTSYQKMRLSSQEENKKDYGKGVDEILVKQDNSLPLFVAGVYLLNPYTVLTCGGLSTVALTNLSIALGLWMRLQRSEVLSALLLSIAAYLSLYPVALFCPFVLISYTQSKSTGVVKFITFVIMWCALLLFVSRQLTGSWDFVEAVYGVILSVPDQSPNLGLFWYFFTETFEHFRVFFLCVFQINAFIYVLPLTIRFSNHPVFLSYILLSLMALFKSYPCVGDLTVPLALLPLWSHTFRYLRYTLVVMVMFLLSSVLCPVLWYLWIHAGSANANFFFAMTLTYALAQIFLLADVIYSFLVHQYDLHHGLPRVDSNGALVKLKLT